MMIEFLKYLLIVGGIILGIVAMQSWLTTRENPADSLKSE